MIYKCKSIFSGQMISIWNVWFDYATHFRSARQQQVDFMQPKKLTVRKDKRSLEILFPDGENFEYPAEALRVMSPSAEVKGHSPDQRKTVSGKRNVEILKMEPVGNYAVRITFDDMHDTGIYSWKFFRELGENYPSRWQEYLDELIAKNLDRDN